MRKAEESEQHALLQQKQYNARRFQEQREINAVASSFGSLFHKTAKFHYYTPVHPSHEQSTTATAANTTTEANNNNAASLTSPSNIERLRKTRTRGLLSKHTTLTTSLSATQNHLLPSSLHDVDRPLRIFKSMRSLNPNEILSPQVSVPRTEPQQLAEEDYEATHYLQLCRSANVVPISKLLNTIAPPNSKQHKTKRTLKRLKQAKQVLNLKGKGLTARSLDILTKSVIPNFNRNGLTELNLSDNRALGTQGIQVLLQALNNGSSPHLKHLDLSSCNLHNAGAFQAMTLLLPTTENNLGTIKLSNNEINDGFVHSFCKLYKNVVPLRRKADLTRLIHLDLCQNNIGPPGGVVLGNTIGECGSALETLLLGWNHIGNKGADEILAGFARVKPVTRISRLDLSMNSLSTLNNLQSFLSGTRTLTLVALNLSHNQLGPKVAEDLVTALSVRNRVQELKIGFNPLGLIGTARIVEASRQNALRTLLIENTIIKLPGKQQQSSTTVESTNPTEHDDEDTENEDSIDHFDLSADVQYIWELAQRVKRAKSVLLMMRARRKFQILIEVEYPPQDREATNRMFQPVMSWLSGRARRDHGEDTNASGKGGNGNEEEIEQNTDSVFHSRIAESESRSFWDSPHVIGAAFEEDFIKLNWHKIIKLNHAQETKLHDTLKSHFVLLKELFHYYAATKSGRAKGGFSITMNGMHSFVDDMGLWPKGKDWPRSKLDMLFVQAAVDRHKQDALLQKSKRAKYLHKDMDDDFSLGTGTGLHSKSIDQIVNTRHQIAEIHAVRARLALQEKQAMKRGNTPNDKKKKKKRASYHEDDPATKKEQKKLQAAVAKQSLVTTMKHKKHKKKKKKTQEELKKKGDKEAKERKEKRASKRKSDKEESNKESTGGRSFGAQTLRRSEFIGFVFRLAIERFFNSKEVQTAEDAVTKMMEDFIIPNAFKDVGSLVEAKYLFDRNMFRDEKLYFVEIDQVVRDNFLALQAIYAKHSSDDSVGSSENFAYKGRFQEGDVMKMNDFISVINSMDRKDFVEKCSRRAINIAFVFSQMLCSGDDDAGSQASFCEFLEALARLADMCIGRELKGMSIPLSIVFRQVVDSLVKGNKKAVDRFSSRMEQTTAKLAKQVSSSKVTWSKEARSNSLDMTMAWMARVKKKTQQQPAATAVEESKVKVKVKEKEGKK